MDFDILLFYNFSYVYFIIDLTIGLLYKFCIVFFYFANLEKILEISKFFIIFAPNQKPVNYERKESKTLNNKGYCIEEL